MGDRGQIWSTELDGAQRRITLTNRGECNSTWSKGAGLGSA